MTEAERAVIEAAVEWQHILEGYGPESVAVELREIALIKALNELHNEHDGKWRPSND